MALISIFISLFLDRYLDAYKHLRELEFYGNFLDKLLMRVRVDGEVAVLMAVGLPAIGMWLLQALLGDFLFGLGWFILSIVTLFICFGPMDLEKEVERYLDTLKSGDDEQIKACEQNILRLVGRKGAEAEDGVVTAVLVAANTHIVSVIFWFILFGPMGAVLYRTALFLVETPVAAISTRDKMQAAAHRLLGILTWIPARLLGFAYALTGCFKDTIDVLLQKREAPDIYTENCERLAEAGLAALCQEPGFGESSETIPPNELRAEQVRSTKALVFRGLILWLAVVALMTLAGWFA